MEYWNDVKEKKTKIPCPLVPRSGRRVLHPTFQYSNCERSELTCEKVEQEREKHMLSYEAKRKALAIREFIADMGPEDLSEKFRERYK